MLKLLIDKLYHQSRLHSARALASKHEIISAAQAGELDFYPLIVPFHRIDCEEGCG
ncbi:MAG: hypothetical protein Q7K40_05215 [bacterium]|nr:hypothetical protein [bacterium]